MKISCKFQKLGGDPQACMLMGDKGKEFQGVSNTQSSVTANVNKMTTPNNLPALLSPRQWNLTFWTHRHFGRLNKIVWHYSKQYANTQSITDTSPQSHDLFLAYSILPWQPLCCFLNNQKCLVPLHWLFHLPGMILLLSVWLTLSLPSSNCSNTLPFSYGCPQPII